MAKVVLGVGASHSPMLNMEPPAWLERGLKDDKVRVMRDFDGAEITYDGLLAKVSPHVAKEITMEKIEARHKANQLAIEKTAEAIYAAKPDVIVMFGDDHMEVYKNDNMPSLAVYWGDTIPYAPTGIMKWPYADKLKTPIWYPQEEINYPVSAELGHHIISHMIEDGFDVAQSKFYPPGQAMSHAFGFVFWRLMNKGSIPVVPVHLNTYFPPIQPTPRRCYEIGQGLRRAIEAWPKDMRVVVLGSGGLSHFVVDEDLDREFLDVLASKSIDRVSKLPRPKLNSGNSELRCWLAAAGAVEDKKMEVIDYVPCYRTPAGTGCAMAFATWQ